jgi:ABC-2 type transport system permease protein
MTAPAGSAPVASTFPRLYRVVLEMLVTRARVLALGGLAVIAVLLSIAVHATPPYDRSDAAWQLVDSYGLSLLVPVVALVFASASLGDPSEDGTLVYLWLRPIPRWQLAVAAFAASLTLTVPLAVAPMILASIIASAGARLVGATAVALLIAAVAYSAVFCGLGLRVRRALVWGMAYLLIWEQAVARVSHGAARLSLFISARSVLAWIDGHQAPRNAVSPVTGIVFPAAVTIVALWLTRRSLDRGEVT